MQLSHTVWGIPEQGTDKQGANFDRWATGPGGSPSTISDTGPAIQNQATNDENQIRYGAQDTNEDPPPSLPFADQSGFGFADCNAPGFPNKILYTHEMAADKADLYALLVPLR